MDIETLIARAEALLCWMGKEAAAAELMATGVSAGDAYLAVMAATINVHV